MAPEREPLPQPSPGLARSLLHIMHEGDPGPLERRIIYETDGGQPTPIPHFRCRCGRVRPADAMVDLAPAGQPGVPANLRGEDRVRCDGCWRDWVARGRISADALRDALGWPRRLG